MKSYGGASAHSDVSSKKGIMEDGIPDVFQQDGCAFSVYLLGCFLAYSYC